MGNYYYELVNFWIEKLVDNKKNYEIKVIQNKKDILIEIYVKKEYIGKVMGRNGKLITSIRNLIGSIQKNKKETITIKVLERV